MSCCLDLAITWRSGTVRTGKSIERTCRPDENRFSCWLSRGMKIRECREHFHGMEGPHLWRKILNRQQIRSAGRKRTRRSLVSPWLTWQGCPYVRAAGVTTLQEEPDRN